MPRKKAEQAPAQIGVIYARYSSHNQKEESIEQQVEECLAFAKANNIKIVQVYADKAISGKTDRRASFQKMLRDAEKHRFEVVVAYKSNRIARNMLNALQYEARLEKYGIHTVYAKEEFGNTAAGRFALRTMMNVNQFYSENLSEDVRRGMRDNAEACKVNGRLPIGYRKSSDGRYELDEAGAVIVREIFAKFLDNVPLADVARELNARGIKTGHGNKWNKNSFTTILRNTNYIGVYRYMDVVVEGGVPAIIEPEIFERTQKKLEAEKSVKRRKTAGGEYLLTGKLYCGKCGSYMTGISGTSMNGTPHYYYSCAGKPKGECNMKNRRRDWLEETVARLTVQYVFQPGVIEWIANNAVQLQMQSLADSGLDDMQAAMAEKKKALNNIMAAIEAGIFTDTTQKRMLELEAEIKELQKEIDNTKRLHKPIEKERIIFALEQYKDADIHSKATQKVLIDTFVKAVYLWDDNIRIDYWYAGNKNSVTIPISAESASSVDSPCSYELPYGSPQNAVLNDCVFLFYTRTGRLHRQPSCSLFRLQPHIPKELLDKFVHSDGVLFFFQPGDAHVPVISRFCGIGIQLVRAALEHQLRQQTHTQTAFHHGHDGIVILDGILLLGTHTGILKHFLGDVAVSGFQKHKGLLPELLQRHSAPGQRMLRRQNDVHAVRQKLPEIELLGIRRRHKANVHRAVSQPFGNLGHIALKEFEADVWIGHPKAFQIGRQPLAG